MLSRKSLYYKTNTGNLQASFLCINKQSDVQTSHSNPHLYIINQVIKTFSIFHTGKYCFFGMLIGFFRGDKKSTVFTSKQPRRQYHKSRAYFPTSFRNIDRILLIFGSFMICTNTIIHLHIQLVNNFQVIIGNNICS